MGLALPCPAHTTLSRRNATVGVRRTIQRAPQGPVCVIVDSTGFKRGGQGDWHAQNHGEQKRKAWKQLHLGVEDQGDSMASTVTDGHEQDPSQGPARWSPVERDIACFIGDGMYDKAPVYAAVMDHSAGARVSIPPRNDAVLSPTAATAPTHRDQPLRTIEHEGRLAWKRTSGYDAQSPAEHAFARDTRTFGGHMRAKRDAAQEREASLAGELRNRMRELGRPQSYAVS